MPTWSLVMAWYALRYSVSWFRSVLMNRRAHLEKASRLLPFVALLLGACSLLSTDLEATQCETTSDCRARGTAFAGTTCQASLCVSSGMASDGAAGASSGSECEGNGECIDKNFGNPYICRQGECVSLTVPGECPIVLGAGENSTYLRKPDPLLFGAYSLVDPSAPRLSVPTLNYELAIDEVNTETGGGIPGGSGGTSRPFIAVVCNGVGEPDLELSLNHLIDHLEVPAILSSLYAPELKEAFNTKGLPEEVFFLSPLEADSTLTSIDDRGLLWHMLPPATDLAPAYVALLQKAETHIRQQRGLSEDQPIRVAMVDAKTQFLTDLADELQLTLSFNGLNAFDNGDNFMRTRVDSAQDVENPDVSGALTKLQDFRPHIVLALLTSEFTLLLDTLEGLWATGWADCPASESGAEQRCPPFYIVSRAQFERTALADDRFAGVHHRLLGVNFAGAEDTELYDLYLNKLRSTYDVPFSLAGSENFYDAAYYLMYSMVGAGDPPRLTGAEVALGMTRLINGRTEYNVGTRDINDAFGVLLGTPTAKISLVGTMGPPSFNTSTGARDGLPSVYCIEDGSYIQDALRYDAETQTLIGTQPCIADFPE